MDHRGKVAISRSSIRRVDNKLTRESGSARLHFCGHLNLPIPDRKGLCQHFVLNPNPLQPISRRGVPVALTENDAAKLFYFPPEIFPPSAITASPGFMPAGQLPRYLESVIITVSDLPSLMCISI
jgi:hypothetical protein